MGAWGTGNFDNDAALDFLSALYPREDGCGHIEKALAKVLPDADEADVDEADAHACCQALAAAEIVAALGGAPRDGLSESVTDWVWYRRPVEDSRLDAITELARRAVRQVRDDSELSELWQQTDSHDAWRAAVDELAARLDRAPVAPAPDEPLPSHADKFSGTWRVDVDRDLDLERCIPALDATSRDYIVADTDEGVLYLTSEYPLTALDLRTGQPRWETYEAARPLMILGDVLLAQDRPARLPFKNLHLVLLDRQTGEPLQKFKARFDDLLVGDFDDLTNGPAERDTFLRCEARRAGAKVYITWESGIYPPAGARSTAAIADMDRSRGALCLDPAERTLQIVDPDRVPAAAHAATHGARAGMPPAPIRTPEAPRHHERRPSFNAHAPAQLATVSNLGKAKARLGDVVLYRRADGVIHAVDATAGVVLWRHKLQ
ncbi:DUF4259 domain-containing protein [Persicimonas caeni]|nr:DUF4259 domain-containing protein [Persicimonas caeni]